MRGVERLFGELVVPWLYVSAGIICLLIAIFAIRSLFRDGEESAAAPGRLLLDCREMLARGEITEDEYRKIKSRMSLRRGDPRPPRYRLPLWNPHPPARETRLPRPIPDRISPNPRTHGLTPPRGGRRSAPASSRPCRRRVGMPSA